ncbi:hypothetical protein RHMOL_Rhmol10G0087400 [Rhododendron molle]|uniref:Uncharacterized protein n=1 Tax=Rhododendron molle TaxID=49168 RepID=A0ACC0M1J1_RHOML|nr:hypothetical protein RHMOL_Rhmol10G0087400 [Rhododendron molle]
MASGQDAMGSFSIPDWKGPVVCPRPRRVGILVNDLMRPTRCHTGHQAEVFDSKVGAELLDLILMKGQSATQLASSPPFFSGSPPTRTANPLTEDSRFVSGKITPTSLSASPVSSSSDSPSSARKGGCIRLKFGHKPAAVRVEGFDCAAVAY